MPTFDRGTLVIVVFTADYPVKRCWRLEPRCVVQFPLCQLLLAACEGVHACVVTTLFCEFVMTYWLHGHRFFLLVSPHRFKQHLVQVLDGVDIPLLSLPIHSSMKEISRVTGPTPCWASVLQDLLGHSHVMDYNGPDI